MPSLITLPAFPSLQPKPPKPSRKQPRALRFPKGEALRYSRELMQVVRDTEAIITYHLIPALEGLTRQAEAAFARVDDAAEDLERVMDRLLMVIPLSEQRAAQIAVEMLQRVQLNHGVQFLEAYDGLLPINPFLGQEDWLPAQMRLRAKQNVSLIKSLPQQLLGDVEALVTSELLKGTHSTDLAGLIQERFGVAENRAVLIAQDQTSKWFGSLNKARQQDAGVDEYEWLTANDAVVRPKHRALNHTKRKWGEGIEPGEEVRCRCQAIPVIPDDLDEEEWPL
jgi:SPP1 gp7 family putative phage head morphogenesis protein